MRPLSILLSSLLLSAPLCTVAGEPFHTDDPRLQRHAGRWFLEGVALNGHLESRYEDGAIKTLASYRDGLRNGLAQGWWPNGELRFERNYRADLLEGEALEWYATGQMRYRQQFEAGRESGLQEGWQEDGKPVFAYAYQDGRRYGVLGSRPCFTSNPDAKEAFNDGL
jgi:hypothetical protein